MNKKHKKNIDSNAILNPRMPWWNETIYGTELLGMRLLRKKSIKEMAKVTGEDPGFLASLEKDKNFPVPPPIAGAYMIYLSCGMHHVYQFRNIVDGKTNKFQEGRTISSKLKKEVYEKCNYKCVKCGSKENLHIHHIKEFAKGGLNELNNLILLCVSCHADIHKDNKAYNLLKKAADKTDDHSN